MEKDYYDQLKPVIFNLVINKLKNAKMVVEIGCGNCRLVNHIAQNVGCQVVGVDLEKTSLVEGKKDSHKLGVGHLVTCIRGDAESLSSLVKKKFDACVSLYVFHELKRPLKVLLEAKKILEKNGEVIMVDYPRGSIAEDLYHEKYYTPEKMVLFFKQVGFRKVHLKLEVDKNLMFVQAKK